MKQENVKQKQWWAYWPLYLALIFIAVVGAGLSLPCYACIEEASRQAEASNNARQLLMFFKHYSAEHEGKYPDSALPDATDSNEVFRLLVKEGYIEEEQVFTSPVSPAKRDKKLGSAPDFLEAVAKGENHWAMTAGLDDSKSSNAPLIFENPAEASWPPRWNADAAGKLVWGRSWRKGKIIIGKNDGSVGLEQLADIKGAAVPLKPDAEGNDCFTRYSPTGRILNVLK